MTASRKGREPGHILRGLAARWLALGPAAGGYVLLGTPGLSALGYEHVLSEPVINLWNETPPAEHTSRGEVSNQEVILSILAKT